jgi:hypothetical protein
MTIGIEPKISITEKRINVTERISLTLNMPHLIFESRKFY